MLGMRCFGLALGLPSFCCCAAILIDILEKPHLSIYEGAMKWALNLYPPYHFAKVLPCQTLPILEVFLGHFGAVLSHFGRG